MRLLLKQHFPACEILESLRVNISSIPTPLTHTQNETDIQAAAVPATLQETHNMAFVRHKSSELIISLKSRCLFLLDVLTFVFRLQGWGYGHVKDKRWVATTGKKLDVTQGTKDCYESC